MMDGDMIFVAILPIAAAKWAINSHSVNLVVTGGCVAALKSTDESGPWDVISGPWGVGGRTGSALVGVLTVIDEEFAEVSQMLGASLNIPGTAYYVQSLNEGNVYETVVAQLDGRGNVKSISAATAMIEAFHPPYILLVGIAGGVKDRDGTTIGDVIVPNYIDYYEMRKLVEGKSLRRCEPYDHPGSSLRQNFAVPVGRRKAWINRVDHQRRPAQDGIHPSIRTGPLISGEKVLGDDEAEIQQKILREYDNALAVDMESFGLGAAVYAARSTRHYNPQYIVIRGVSDLIRHIPPGQAAPPERAIGDLPNNEVRRLWKGYAAHVAAAFALAVVDEVVANTIATPAQTRPSRWRWRDWIPQAIIRRGAHGPT
jgi:nucleoside phosphorylase